jgi:hypothetical protein
VKTGIQKKCSWSFWIPAFAGMTEKDRDDGKSMTEKEKSKCSLNKKGRNLRKDSAMAIKRGSMLK